MGGMLSDGMLLDDEEQFDDLIEEVRRNRDEGKSDVNKAEVKPGPRSTAHAMREGQSQPGSKRG